MSGPRFTLKGDKIQLSENDVRRACLDVLGPRGWLVRRQHVGRFNPVGRPNEVVTIGEAGDPDYLIVKAPSFFMETKRPGGKLSDAQKKRIEVLRQFYSLDTVVVESVDDLVGWLDRTSTRK